MCEKIISDINCNTIVQNESFTLGNVYVYVLQLNKTNDNTITQVFIRENPEEQVKFTIGEDGYYTLCKVVVSTDPTSKYYYKDGKFYKNIELVELSELIYTNPETSGLELTYYYYFQLCKLRKCYIKAAEKILNGKTINCNQVISLLDIYMRDLLLSALNSIQYLAEMELFEEAERLLERITGCNGLCKDNTSKCGCGCGG